MHIDVLPLGVLLVRQFLEVGKEISFHLLLVEEIVTLVDDCLLYTSGYTTRIRSRKPVSMNLEAISSFIRFVCVVPMMLTHGSSTPVSYTHLLVHQHVQPEKAMVYVAVDASLVSFQE